MKVIEDKHVPIKKVPRPQEKRAPFVLKEDRPPVSRYSQRRQEPIEPGMPRPSQPFLAADQLDECFDWD